MTGMLAGECCGMLQCGKGNEMPGCQCAEVGMMRCRDRKMGRCQNPKIRATGYDANETQATRYDAKETRATRFDAKEIRAARYDALEFSSC